MVYLADRAEAVAETAATGQVVQEHMGKEMRVAKVLKRQVIMEVVEAVGLVATVLTELDQQVAMVAQDQHLALAARQLHTQAVAVAQPKVVVHKEQHLQGAAAMLVQLAGQTVHKIQVVAVVELHQQPTVITVVLADQVL